MPHNAILVSYRRVNLSRTQSHTLWKDRCVSTHAPSNDNSKSLALALERQHVNAWKWHTHTYTVLICWLTIRLDKIIYRTRRCCRMSRSECSNCIQMGRQIVCPSCKVSGSESQYVWIYPIPTNDEELPMNRRRLSCLCRGSSSIGRFSNYQ
jgi:hypothetical protein